MSKTIILDGIEYTLTPKYQYKPGDWVIYMDVNKNIVKRVISDEEYKNSSWQSANEPESLASKYGDWMTLPSIQVDKDKNWNYVIRLAHEPEIAKHLWQLAVNKGFKKGCKVNSGDISGSLIQELVQESTVYYSVSDEFFCGGIRLYCRGNWATIKSEPKFTFGGQEVTFAINRHIDNFKKGSPIIEVTCKGETGTHYEISQILNHYFRPVNFGKVTVKSYTLKEGEVTLSYGLNVKNIKFPTWDANSDKNKVEDITIGCLTGKYEELRLIFEECSRLLKETR